MAVCVGVCVCVWEEGCVCVSWLLCCDGCCDACCDSGAGAGHDMYDSHEISDMNMI